LHTGLALEIDLLKFANIGGHLQEHHLQPNQIQIILHMELIPFNFAYVEHEDAPNLKILSSTEFLCVSIFRVDGMC
jgi:hypothetical protein